MPLKVPKLHKLTKELKPFFGDRFLLSVSGGLDSMALLHLFLHFRKHFEIQFAVTYFHHGPSDEAEQLEYRFEAYEMVRDLCGEKSIEFFCNFSGEDKEAFLKSFGMPLSSEDDCRKARYRYIESVKEEKSFDWIVLAHHKDDLFETRLLRLIRGVGEDRLFSMSFISEDRMRPLLEFSKKELITYMESQQGAWLDDPSNTEAFALRNWVRNDWLPLLEDKRPGSIASFSRSLENLMSENESEKLDFSQFITEQSLIVSDLLRLGRQNKMRVVAEYLRQLRVKNYGQSHIEEVLKRLDTSQKSHTFQLLGRRWKVDAGRMSQEDLA